MSLATFVQNEQLRMQSARVLGLGRAPLRAAVPVVDLLVRLTLAKAFFAPGMFPGIGAAGFPTAWPAIIMQVIGPILLAVGLWARPVAVLMLEADLEGAVLGRRARRVFCSGRRCSAGILFTDPRHCRSTVC
jgi:hypothetical protein